MLILAWVISLIAAFMLGSYSHQFIKRVEKLEKNVKNKIDKPKEEPESSLVDPTDDLWAAQYEQKKIMERLNGKQ